MRRGQRHRQRSVTRVHMHALLRTLTLMDMGTRGMGELNHDQERVGRPSLAFSRLVLSEDVYVPCVMYVCVCMYSHPPKSPVAVPGAGVSRMCSGRGSFHRKNQVKSSQVSEERRVQFRQRISRSFTVSRTRIVRGLSVCDLSRACTRFYGLSRLWTLAPEAWASWTTTRSEWDDRVSPCHVRYSASIVGTIAAKISPSVSPS
jgi:hypothetical protein